MATLVKPVSGLKSECVPQAALYPRPRLYLLRYGRCIDAKFMCESMSQLAAASTTTEAAFKKLEQKVSDDHARDFYNTELKDVRHAVLDKEKWQRPRESLRNMARIEPLFAGLQQYAGPLKTLCQGTPYMPFIWVSLKGAAGCTGVLFISIGSDQIDAAGTRSTCCSCFISSPSSCPSPLSLRLASKLSHLGSSTGGHRDSSHQSIPPGC